MEAKINEPMLSPFVQRGLYCISQRIAVWVDKSYNEAPKASDGNCARMVVMTKAGNILPK